MQIITKSPLADPLFIRKSPGLVASAVLDAKGERIGTQYMKVSRSGKAFAVRRKIFGICVHTMGSGPWKLRFGGKTAFEDAINYYVKPDATLANYGIDYETGKIVQIVDESLCAPHCGVPGWLLQAMQDGTWKEQHLSATAQIIFRKFESETAAIPRGPSPEAVKLWIDRWQSMRNGGTGYNFKAPRYLYPSKSSNTDYIGIELLPCKPGDEKGTIIRYSEVQLDALAKLIADITLRWNLRIRKIGEKFPTLHLLGHEDLNPARAESGGRWDGVGGWDPGSLRPVPRFSWDDLGLRLSKLGV